MKSEPGRTSVVVLNQWSQPRGVLTAGVLGIERPSAAMAGSPSGPSMSSTTMPLGTAMPTLALGSAFHQRRIVNSSNDALSRPCGARRAIGCLAMLSQPCCLMHEHSLTCLGPCHGNTGRPTLAYSTAAATSCA